MDKVVHFEIPADDLKRADDFYKTVFGWDIQVMPMEGGEYHMVTTVPTDENQMPKEAGAINGGLYQREKPEQRPIFYIDVPNIDEHLKKIEEKGGKVVLPKAPIPGMGAYAQIADTEGNVIGLFENALKGK